MWLLLSNKCSLNFAWGGSTGEDQVGYGADRAKQYHMAYADIKANIIDMSSLRLIF